MDLKEMSQEDLSSLHDVHQARLFVLETVNRTMLPDDELKLELEAALSPSTRILRAIRAERLCREIECRQAELDQMQEAAK